MVRYVSRTIPLSSITRRKEAMGNAIGTILPQAISPVPIIAVILMLFSQPSWWAKCGPWRWLAVLCSS